jgi:hypothetical protein
MSTEGVSRQHFFQDFLTELRGGRIRDGELLPGKREAHLSAAFQRA